MTTRTRRLSRRNFMLAVGAGGAVTAAAAIVATNAPKQARPAAEEGERASRGYHASAHVNNYYRTTKV